MKRRLVMVLIMLGLLALACNMPSGSAVTPTAGTPATGTANVLTYIAQTVTAVTSEPAAGTATFTPEPGQPQDTAVALATATSQPCNQAQFIADVTIPDNTQLKPGEGFTKTWRLRNVGTCAWDGGYALVFSGGDALGAPAAVNLPGGVSPNDVVDLSLEMRAPTAPGTYVSRWRLRSADGELFGVMANQPIYAQIVVTSATPTATLTRAVTNTPPSSGVIYDFAANACKAQWISESGALPCPGTSGDSKGMVVRLENPRLETGSTVNTPVLLTVPNTSPSGAIVARYPAIAVQRGDRFQTTIGCLSGMNNCSVIYQLNYSVNQGEPVALGEWTEKYDGSTQDVNIDLTPLAGKSIEIILVVLANGSADQDQAVWVNPRLVRP